MIPLPKYKELHVVSDLHLGGLTPERQIFNQGAEFENLIEILLRSPEDSAETNQALLINGDLVDFLADPNAAYFDPIGAADKLAAILKNDSFSPVWKALRKFVGAPNRTLIITLGNHDLELSLPWIRSQLLEALSEGDPAKKARIVLAFEEGGYRCQVGGASVLCVHGNEVDPWNVTDYEALRRIGQSALREGPLRAWTPNGGSKLVIDVMNDVKKRYAFVDLLKPEEGGVIPTLLVLKPQLVSKIAGAMPSWLRSRWDQLRMASGFLGEEESELVGHLERREELAPVLNKLLGDTFGDTAKIQPIIDLDDLLLRTEERLREGVTPLHLLGHRERSEFLGIAGAVRNMIFRKGRAEVLREALEKLRSDRSFKLATADDTFRSLDQKISPDIDFIVSGHTHLERVLPRGNGEGYYFNSGTWVRLINLTDQMLESEASFRRIYQAFEKGSMAALDKEGSDEEALVRRRPAVVSIWADAKGAYGELRHVKGSKFQSQMPPRRVRIKP